MKTPLSGRPDPARRQPLWDRVDANKLKLAAYVIVFVAIAVLTFQAMLLVFGGCLVVWVISELRLYELAEWLYRADFASFVAVLNLALAVPALAWAIWAISRSELWLVKRLGATLVPKGELLESKMALKDMALAAGMDVAPAFYLIENSTVNAFEFSARGRRPIVGVTRGLVNKLTVDEQRAVFANLVARIASGDTIVNTGIAALMLPLHAWRDRTNAAHNRSVDFGAPREPAPASTPRGSGGGEAALFVFFFGFAMAIVGALFSAFQRHRQLRAAEKADAEGMLLLKDPRAMLSALEKCVRYDNVVPTSGEAFSDLFYCWADDSTNDEDDPEWRRVARLREVLGVEGHVPDCPPVREGLAAPPPPRLDQSG